eukprot:sb/3470409/
MIKLTEKRKRVIGKMSFENISIWHTFLAVQMGIEQERGSSIIVSRGRSSNSQISKQPDNKVKRTTYSDHQKKVMSHYYENGNRYLESSMRKKIAEELGLRPDQVKRKWQNMRAQDKQITPNFGLNTGSYCSSQSSFMIDRNRGGLARIRSLTDNAAQRRTTGNYQNNIQLYQNNTSGFFSASRQDSGSKSLGSHLPFSNTLGAEC